MEYDLCIVGAGMTGSAAARWATQHPGLRVCLLGPLEPTEQVGISCCTLSGLCLLSRRSVPKPLFTFCVSCI